MPARCRSPPPTACSPPEPSLVNSGGTFDLNGFAQTVDAFNGAGTITNNSTGTATDTLTVGSNNSGGTFSGLISNGATAKVALTNREPEP